MHATPSAALLAAVTTALVGLPTGATAHPPTGATAHPPTGAERRLPVIPTLIAVHAVSTVGVDRLVFEFRGPLPARHDVRYVRRVVSGTSGRPVPVAGDAFLQITFSPAVGHDTAGNTTYGPTRRTFALPNVVQAVTTEDFEAVLGFGVGLARRAPVHVSTLTDPSRVLVDVDAPFRTVPVRDYFLDETRFVPGVEPYVRPVSRPVIPPHTARGALQRLFAGPTRSEQSAGLVFVNSDATGFADLSLRDSVARVRLTGGCSSHGSTFTVADEIMPTLRQFRGVRWVKIYDPSGHTERPAGRSDSIPTCLEP